MTELEPVGEIMVPLTGELVSLAVPADVARALAQVRDLKHQLDDVRVVLEDVLRLESERQGTKTLHLDGGLTAVVSGGEKVEWDIEKLVDLLQQEGLPEQRLRDLVVATVSYRVNQSVARSIAGANPRYALALEASKTVVPAAWYVKVE